MQPRRGLAERPGLGGEVWYRPVLADTVLADTVLADTVLAGPVLAGPVLAGPVLAGPVLTSAAQARRGQRPAVAGAGEEHRQDGQYNRGGIACLRRRRLPAGRHLDPAERRGDQL